MKEFIKKHKKTCIIGGIALVLLIVLIIMFLIMFPMAKADNYGDRLDGIEKHKISNSLVSEIKDEINAKEGVDKVTYNKEGRILNFIITFDGSVDAGKAKEYAGVILEKIDKDDLEYYDIQVFINTKEEKEGFPNAGYKHKTEEKLIWGNVGEKSE